MKRFVKYSLITAGVCILSGAALTTAGSLFGGSSGFWLDRNGLHSNSELHRQQSGDGAALDKTIIEDITSADIVVNYQDIIVADSADDNFYLEYKIPMAGSDPQYEVVDGELVFRFEENRGDSSSNVVQFFVVNTDEIEQRGYVKLYIPQKAFLENVTLSATDGRIVSGSFQADNVEITAKFGSVRLEQIDAKQVMLKSSDGTVEVSGGKADIYTIEHSFGSTRVEDIETGNLTIESNDGSITMENLLADTISIKHKFGTTMGENITVGALSSDQSDGSFQFENTNVDHADIKNDFGSVKLELNGRENDYNYDVRTKFGSVRINDVKYEDGEYRRDNETERMIKVKGNDGSVEIKTME